MSLRKFYSHCAEANSCHYSVYDTTPTTFVVQSNCSDSEYSSFVLRFQELASHIYMRERIPAKHCAENVWLIKPCAMNQGKGIEIFNNNLPEMRKFLQSKAPFSHWVVQKYIERPLLYTGRKFDIRMWTLITWKKEFYFYRYGYVRTSSDVYTLDSKLNYVHLTNNCLQKYGEKYGAFEDGNTLGFDKFTKYIAEQYPNAPLDFQTHLIDRMKDIMIDCFLAVKRDLNQANRRNCFELLGFDFLLDEDFRVWLLEVNTNPYLGIPNKYIEGLLPKMLNDLYEIVLDPYVPPINKQPPRGISPPESCER